MQGNDGYLYLFIDEQTPYIWKKVQIGVKAVGNILQSTQCMMGVLYLQNGLWIGLFISFISQMLPFYELFIIYEPINGKALQYLR